MGKGISDVLWTSPQMFLRILLLFSIVFHPVTFESVDDATLLGYRIFVFGCPQEVFNGFASFEVHLYTMFSAGNFYAFTQAFCIGYHYVASFVDEVGTVIWCFLGTLVAFCLMIGALILFFILFKAHVGYLHLVRTFCRCFCSSYNCCVVNHTALALWKVYLSHCIQQIWYGGYPTASTGLFELLF